MMDSSISAKDLYLWAGAPWSAGGGVDAASEGLSMDFKGLETRVWGKGRSGELWSGVKDCGMRPLARVVHG